MQSMGREKISALLISPHFRALLICRPSFYMTRLNVLYASNVDVWYRPNLTLIAQCALPDPMCQPNALTQCVNVLAQCALPDPLCQPNALTQCVNVLAQCALPDPMCSPNVAMYIA